MNRAMLQSTINPYELISTTLHDNEFSPSLHIFNLRRDNEFSTYAARRDGVNQFRNETMKVNYSQIGSAQQVKPPVPAVKSLPLSVKMGPKIISTGICI